MRDYTFVIANHDKSGFIVAGVSFETDKRSIKDPASFKKALKAAVSDWMLESDEGAGVASANPDGFHIGHLGEYIDDDNDLDDFLERHGIHELEIWSASHDDTAENWPYGENLVDQTRVTLGEGFEEGEEGDDDEGDEGDDDDGSDDAGDDDGDDDSDDADGDDDGDDADGEDDEPRGVEYEDDTVLEWPDEETGRIRQIDEDGNLIEWRDPEDEGYDDWNDLFDPDDRWERPDDDETEDDTTD